MKITFENSCFFYTGFNKVNTYPLAKNLTEMLWEIKGACLGRLWATWNKYGNKYRDFLLILVNIEPGEKQATVNVRFG